MHVFNDEGWFTGREIPALLHAHVYSGFKYQLIDLRRIPAHKVTKICFCGDHDDLAVCVFSLTRRWANGRT